MSGLAEMLLIKGFRVKGSDRDDGYLLDRVRDKGIPVTVGHKKENIQGADLVVFSAAIPENNPEREEARKLGIPEMERAELLGQLMSDHEWAVGVCGAHGKTTTTAMICQALVENGADPSIHIGGVLDAVGGSTRAGKSNIFVAEACEYNRSFLHMHPTMAVVLNIDADHLDCYRDIDEIEQTFGRFMRMVPPQGYVIGNGDDPRVRRQMEDLSCRKVTFGLGEDNDWYAAGLQEEENADFSFDLMHSGTVVEKVHMGIPGIFNVMNALAAFAACSILNVPVSAVANMLSRFTGAHRRFERTDIIDGVEIYHDYGHNPVEMRNALQIARKRCKGKLWAVMQPHTFSRVKTLFDQYLTCTDVADITLVTDICAAREPDPGDINSGMLVEGMKNHGIRALWTPSFDDTERYLRDHWSAGDLVLTMGCGDINMLNAQIHRHQEEGKV